jgi:hypothetical protein
MTRPVIRIGRTLIFPNGKVTKINVLQYLGFKLRILNKVKR